MKSSKKEAALLKAGEIIKTARQAKDLSIDQLSDQLRISKDQLEAIEAGNQEDLPELVFIKAMLRRLAEKLDINEKNLIECFEKNKGNTKTFFNGEESPKKKKIAFKGDTLNFLLNSQGNENSSVNKSNYFNFNHLPFQKLPFNFNLRQFSESNLSIKLTYIPALSFLSLLLGIGASKLIIKYHPIYQQNRSIKEVSINQNFTKDSSTNSQELITNNKFIISKLFN